jgi:putative membrane protein
MATIQPERVPAVTAVLSALSLSIVFAAAGGFVPSSAVPAAPESILRAIPTVNVVISSVAIGTIAAGWRAIRRGRVRTHRRAMMTAVGLFVTFLALYLYRLVATGGAAGFDGPAAVYQFVYLPVLIGHIGLAIVCIPLLYYTLGLALSHEIADLGRTAHPRIGRVAASLWMTSFALGIVVYLLGRVLYG